MILAISTTFVRPVNSNFTLPSPEKYTSRVFLFVIESRGFPNA
jgi:hypothetical protein